MTWHGTQRPKLLSQSRKGRPLSQARAKSTQSCLAQTVGREAICLQQQTEGLVPLLSTFKRTVHPAEAQSLQVLWLDMRISRPTRLPCYAWQSSSQQTSSCFCSDVLSIRAANYNRSVLFYPSLMSCLFARLSNTADTRHVAPLGHSITHCLRLTKALSPPPALVLRLHAYLVPERTAAVATSASFGRLCLVDLTLIDRLLPPASRFYLRHIHYVPPTFGPQCRPSA